MESHFPRWPGRHLFFHCHTPHAQHLINNQGSRPNYMSSLIDMQVALICSLLNGKIFREWVSNSVLEAYQWQESDCINQILYPEPLELICNKLNKLMKWYLDSIFGCFRLVTWSTRVT